VERFEAALANIFSDDGKPQTAFTEVFTDTGRREAEAADHRAASGLSRGPLDGKIVSIKALFDVAGSVTSAGSAALRNLPPAVKDADVVSYLRYAGATKHRSHFDAPGALNVPSNWRILAQR
jgi:aspartyl-tRNA(Asn)/glutamyl-tRNA(Gln) amidotransferase subunit A